ncbi:MULTISPECIES: DinB family protein [unclassified Virgibacillus]|uniref:DinB family protein n=1 Tax=unclassified Virgibacillus TaxID=2620237 RepID=UPI0024DF05C9|nr:DinB family protein [Virgibacillus sp. LDC-1]
MKTTRDLVDELSQFNVWVKSLEHMSDTHFFTPIKKDKWSTAEIICHITFWDIYIIEEILPFMKNDASIQSISFDILNKKAAEYANSGVTKSELIDHQLCARTQLVSVLKRKNEEDFHASFTINGDTIDPFSGLPHTMFNYFWSFVWHDNHHKKQIELFIEEKQSKVRLNNSTSS